MRSSLRSAALCALAIFSAFGACAPQQTTPAATAPHDHNLSSATKASARTTGPNDAPEPTCAGAPIPGPPEAPPRFVLQTSPSGRVLSTQTTRSGKLYLLTDAGVSIWDSAQRAFIRHISSDGWPFVPSELALDPFKGGVAVLPLNDSAPEVLLIDDETGAVERAKRPNRVTVTAPKGTRGVAALEKTKTDYTLTLAAMIHRRVNVAKGHDVLSFATNGKSIAGVTFDGAVLYWGPNDVDAKVFKLGLPGDTEPSLAISESGSFALVARGQRLVRLDFSTGQTVAFETFASDGSLVRSVALVEDQKRAWGLVGNDIVAWDTDSGKRVWHKDLLSVGPPIDRAKGEIAAAARKKPKDEKKSGRKVIVVDAIEIDSNIRASLMPLTSDGSIVVVDQARTPAIVRVLDGSTGAARASLQSSVRLPGAIRFDGADSLVVWHDTARVRWNLRSASMAEDEQYPNGDGLRVGAKFVGEQRIEDMARRIARDNQSFALNTLSRARQKCLSNLQDEPCAVSISGEDGKVLYTSGTAYAGDLAARVDRSELTIERGAAIVGQASASGAPFSSVAIDPTGTRIATRSTDGAIRIWSSAGKHLATLVDFDDGEWIAFTPGGAFTGTPEVAPRVGWVFDAPEDAFTFEQFARVYAAEDTVKRRLRGEDVDVKAPTRRPPHIDAYSVTPDPSGSRGSIRATIHAGDRVDRVRAFVDGRPVEDKLVCAASAEVSLDVPLGHASNRVTLVAYDAQGVGSRPSEIDVRGAPLGRPSLWLVGIGISSYPKLTREQQLELADDDAEAIVRELSLQAGPGKPYANVTSRLLRNAEATQKSVLDALSLLEQMAPSDVAVIMVAGHGAKLPDSGDMVLLTADSEFSPTSLATTGIGWKQIQERLVRAKGRVVVLLDACHSGHISRELIVPNNHLAGSLAHAGRSGTIVFAAAKGKQQSYEPSGPRGLVLDANVRPLFSGEPHGLFTGAILQSLRDSASDQNGDGEIQVSELIDDVAARVSRASKGLQTPWVARREMIGDFALTRAVGARAK